MLTMRQRIAVTTEIRYRYRKSIKKDKTSILNEFVQTTGYNRSYARLILGSLKKTGRKRHSPPRKRKYDILVFCQLKKLWVAADCICGQRLKPFLPELIDRLEHFGEIKLTKPVKKKLLAMGSATIDRLLSKTKKGCELKSKGKSTTKPGTLLKSLIVVRTYADWDDHRPGFFETDLVAFCGESVEGDYVNGLNLTDVNTGWVKLKAVMGKGQRGVHGAVNEARCELPFGMLGLDSDNGGEFINNILYRYCLENQISFTRIRANRKNDNCFVEQKNYTVMRRFLGYARYDAEEQRSIIKQLLPLVEDYVNFFSPSQKLKEKTRIGSRIKKQYYQATTPYRKLLASGILEEEKRQRLTDYYKSLNPMELKRKINQFQKKLDKTLRWKINDLTNIDFR